MNLIGGAGTGKTTELMNIIDRLIKEGLTPWDIGFCSFTRAARSTAVSRASSRFDINPEDLEKNGWFRTLHSICYRLLGVKSASCLTRGKSTSEWFNDNFGEHIEIDDDGSFSSAAKSDMQITMNLWSGCRQRCELFAITYSRAELSGTILPEESLCVDIIDRYEQIKRIDDKSDFTDWLGMFSGTSFSTAGHGSCAPRGVPPSITAWLLDEQQDNSELMDRCFRRLVEPARWAYSCGDPFQALFAFNGSDPSLFQKWDFQKRKILAQSYRCPSKILALGERCLTPCSDYWERGIAPVDSEGEISYGMLGDGMSELESSVHNETWLLLSRSNWYAKLFCKMLSKIDVPYTITRGNSQWGSNKKNTGLYALLMLQEDHSINEREWQEVLSLDGLPVKFRDVEMLERGTKAAWKKRDIDEEGISDLAGLPKWGASPELCNLISSGKWVEFFDFAPQFVSAIHRFGHKSVFNPSVIVSTVHSAKGMEADNVIILDAVSTITNNAMRDPDCFDEECRIAYVAVTRAKKRLWIVSDRKAKYRMEIPID